MFLGTTPNEIRIVLRELFKNYKGNVFVACSGNFTSDKLFSLMGLNVYSNDVSLYSKLVSDILLKRNTEIEILNDDLKTVFGIWKESDYKKIIQVMFAMRIGKFASKKNDYQKEFYDNFLEKSESYYENTLNYFEKNKPFGFNIKDFYFGDFIEHLSEKKGKGVGVCFAPTYKRGYEKMFKFVEECFDYKRAEYEIWCPNKSSEIFGAFLESDENIFYTDKDYPALEKYLVSHAVLKTGNRDCFIYSSFNRNKVFFIENKHETKSSIKTIPCDFEITEKSEISFFECKKEDILYFKGLFMSNKVNYTSGADLSLAFCIDGFVFGFASFSLRLSNIDEIYMISDFVVNSEIKKLSKLLIMLVKSIDIRKYISARTHNFYKGVKTSVFTDAPVSMKYRGVFNLKERQKGKLIYVSDFIEKPLNDIFNEYKGKFLQQRMEEVKQ